MVYMFFIDCIAATCLMAALPIRFGCLGTIMVLAASRPAPSSSPSYILSCCLCCQPSSQWPCQVPYVECCCSYVRSSTALVHGQAPGLHSLQCSQWPARHDHRSFIMLKKVPDYVQLRHSRFEIGLPYAAYHDNVFRFRLGYIMLLLAKESGHAIFGHDATLIREMQLAYTFIMKMKGSKVVIYFQKPYAKQSSDIVLVCYHQQK